MPNPTIDENGVKRWYKEGKKHREDGPAVEYTDGSKFWYKEGELHREDGPAIEGANGNKEWWLEGKEYTEEEFRETTGFGKEINEWSEE